MNQFCDCSSKVNLFRKPTRKFPSPQVSLVESSPKKSSRRSVSFRDEHLNVSLGDLNLSVASEPDRSAQWLPNRQFLLLKEKLLLALTMLEQQMRMLILG
jgi:hypothetical protein